MEELSDRELVQLSLEDIQNFKHIINRYEKKLSWYIMRLWSFSEEEGEDILQDIFIKVYLHINEYESPYSFSSWIYRITHNTTIDAHRRRSVWNPLHLDNEVYEWLKETLTTDENISIYLQKEDLRTSLQKALWELKEDQRDVIILKYIEGKDYEEIGDILHIPVGTVATLLHRGKKNLEWYLSSVYNYL